MRGRYLWLAAALCLLTGCAPHAREPEGLALVRVLGVDGGAETVLTAVCGGQDGREPGRGSVAAPDFAAARVELPWCGEREMALTSLSYIIINGEADLETVLMAVLNDKEMSPSATVWLAEDAAELLDACEDPAGRLQVLTDSGAAAPTVVDALAALKNGEAVYLPVLEEENGLLKTEEVR